MSDEFDGCECIWSHEFAIQQLLAMIRRTQNLCTDTECFEGPSGSNQLVTGRSQTTGSDSFSSFFVVLMIVALIMMLVRPESIMKLTKNKKRDQHGDGSQPPSAPPPPPPSPPTVN